MPRALILEPSGNLWGSERALLDFLGAASHSDWELGVCCPPRTPIIGELARLPVRTIPAFTRGLHRLNRRARAAAALRLALTVRRFRPDVLHANEAGPGPIRLL